MKITVNAEKLVSKINLSAYQEKVNAISQTLEKKTGKGNDYLGWLDSVKHYDEKELDLIEKTAKYVRDNYEVLVVCGIGGSYLGARAAIEALGGVIPHKGIQVLYLGQTLDPTYIQDALEYLKDKKFAVNVISKSGTTTETAVCFRLLKKLLEERDGVEEARKAIIATTDKEKGALLALSQKEGYVRFVLPSDIGGRYSVQTAVGLFPIAVMGYDIRKIVEGSKDCAYDAITSDLSKNEAYKYAVIRHHLYRMGKTAEFLVSYNPAYVQLSEWWKQLFGESEGKEHKSLLPVSATFTTDLHSLGQFIQEGNPTFFETIIHVDNHKKDVEVSNDPNNLDGLNYLTGKKLSWINEQAYLGTLKAHADEGKIDNIVINLERMDEYNLGYFFYFMEKACAMSAYLNDVNPFNQPGVEVYKKNMFHLLGKPGH